MITDEHFYPTYSDIAFLYLQVSYRRLEVVSDGSIMALQSCNP